MREVGYSELKWESYRAFLDEETGRLYVDYGSGELTSPDATEVDPDVDYEEVVPIDEMPSDLRKKLDSR